MLYIRSFASETSIFSAILRLPSWLSSVLSGEIKPQPAAATQRQPGPGLLNVRRMCIYIYVCVYVYIYICVYIYIYYMCIYIYYMCIYILYVYIYILCVYIYILCVYIYTYYIYIHTMCISNVSMFNCHQLYSYYTHRYWVKDTSVWYGYVPASRPVAGLTDTSIDPLKHGCHSVVATPVKLF